MRNLNRNKGPTLYLLAFLLLFTSELSADGPAVQIKSAVDQVTGVLKDPRVQGESKKRDRRRLLRQIILPQFDFNEMAKRSLGSEWRRRTLEEQKEFVNVFTDLLESAYVRRIESYNNEKFIYTGERIDGPYAEVHSKVATSKGEEFRIDYRLRRVGNEWKIYDVVVEDISLANNYRSQFNRIIANSSYKELVRRMKEKQLEISEAKE